MTARRFVTIFCDRVGCPRRLDVSVETFWQARENAKGHGWSHALVPRPEGGPAMSRDLCPAHKEES